jgi:hypothetical protein
VGARNVAAAILECHHQLHLVVKFSGLRRIGKIDLARCAVGITGGQERIRRLAEKHRGGTLGVGPYLAGMSRVILSYAIDVVDGKQQLFAIGLVLAYR